jgi:hypothetical protein
MPSSLAIPLRQEQINAANRLHSHLTYWAATDKALSALGAQFPAFDLESALLKVAAINQLYGTNLYAVVRMAEHIAAVISACDLSVNDPALVEAIATLPKKPAEKTQRHYYSFASKFAHFFVSQVGFPIYDSYAVQMVSRHLGPRLYQASYDHPYLAYVANLRRIGEQSGVVWEGRELDRYLWLAGQCGAWRRNARAPINTEVRRLLEQPTQQVIVDVEMLIGA